MDIEVIWSIKWNRLQFLRLKIKTSGEIVPCILLVGASSIYSLHLPGINKFSWKGSDKLLKGVQQANKTAEGWRHHYFIWRGNSAPGVLILN